jgi:hypothetical protein
LAITFASATVLSSAASLVYRLIAWTPERLNRPISSFVPVPPQQLALLLDAHEQRQPPVQVALDRRCVLEQLVRDRERRGDLLDRLDDLGHRDRRLGLRARLGHTGGAR